MLKVVLLASLLLVSGCSGFLEKQPTTRWAILKQESRKCLADLKSDPQLAIIADKVTLDSIYDRDVYFELLNIEEFPSTLEKSAIKKWSAKLERCYKIKAQGYAYEPQNVAIWSAALDSDQLVLILELYKGNLSYAQFAARRLEVDTVYRGKIIQAVAADYKKPENPSKPDFLPQPKNTEIQKRPLTSF